MRGRPIRPFVLQLLPVDALYGYPRHRAGHRVEAGGGNNDVQLVLDVCREQALFRNGDDGAAATSTSETLSRLYTS